MKYVIATNNPGKAAEMQEILSGSGIEILTMNDLGINIDIEETGSTFLENATIKARAVCEAAGMPAIADDSGLVVDALNGEPGLHTSSYGGEKLTPTKRCEFLLDKMENMEHRDAKFVCTIVCVFPTGESLSASGECHGTILKSLQGSGGFGYDPVFKPDGKDTSMAELSSDEKNRISHRGKALRRFIELLTDYNALAKGGEA